MELYAKTTRFCLLCNYVSRIIDPITSRTAKFRFRLLPRDIQMKQVEMIKGAESVNISDNAVEELIKGNVLLHFLSLKNNTVRKTSTKKNIYLNTFSC